MTAEAEAFLGHLMSMRLNRQLDKAVDYLLDRSRYERRGGVPYGREQVGACLRCGSHHCDHFSRNGHRPRTLSLWDCELQLRLPRVVCQCGGSVQLDFAGLIRPYQRLGDEVDAQIQRWGAMSVSLREMQAELTHSRLGGLGQRTLMERLHDLQALTPDLDASQGPPLLQVDAIWWTALQPTATTQADTAGRPRVVKKGGTRPLFIALGVWPETGRREILAWALGASADAAAWLKFLTRLEAEGLRGTNGLKLIIHDG
ncbi:MAG: transposase, partial [Armatimonadota bacterium]